MRSAGLLAVVALMGGTALASAAGAQPTRGRGGSGSPQRPERPEDNPAAQRLFMEGQRRAQQGEIDGALREYQLLVQQFPRSELAEEALLQSALLLRDRGDIGAALEQARRLVEGYPGSPRAAAAFVFQGDLQVAAASSNADLEEARATYRRVPLLYGRETYPRLDIRSEARVRVGEVSHLLGADDEAAAAFLEAIEDEPPSAWTARARWGLATVLLWGRDWVPAAEILQRVVGASGDPAHPEAEAAVAAAARRRLSLIHRLYLRPQTGQPSWTRTTQLTVSGVAFKRPTSVAASEEGGLVITDPASQLAVVLSPQGEVMNRSTAKNPGRPWFVGPEPYLPELEGIRLPLERNLRSFSLPAGDKSKPVEKLYAGERGTFGEWFLLDRGSGLVVFETNRRYRRMLVEDGEAVDIARDGRGRLYVLDRRGKSIERFRSDGGADGRISRPWRRPHALTVDPLGNVYVLEASTGTIEVYGAQGDVLATLGPNLPGGVALRGPEDLAVDGAGRLFIADSKLSSVLVVE